MYLKCLNVRNQNVEFMQIRCIVKPNSKTNSISINDDGVWKIKIMAIPVKGKANEYLIDFLSTFFNLSKKNIEIISGFTSSHKRVNIVANEEMIISIINKN